MRRTLLALAVSLGLAASFGSSTTAGQKPASNTSLKDKFVGTWRLVSNEQRDAKGQVIPPARPGTGTGYIIYDPAGYVAVSLVPPGRKKNAGPQQTDQEALASITGYTGYFGSFIVNDDGSVTHRLQGSLNPGMPVDQKRFYEFSGNRLTLKPPAGANGNQSRITWERVPDLANPTAEQRKFFGFWKLISNERRNAKGEVLSSNPGQFGYIIYTPAGFMMVHMVQPDRKPYAAAQPTAAEARQTLRTYTNYFGPFYVHETDGYVVHDQFGSLGIGRIGPSPQQRFYRFEGRRLLLQPPPTFMPEGDTLTGTITWEKVEGDRATR